MGVGMQEILIIGGLAALLFGKALAPKFYSRAVDSIKAWKQGYKDAENMMEEDKKIIDAEVKEVVEG